jgi:hypothetical protein
MKMLGHPLGTLFKPLIHSGLRLGLTLVIVLMVISSPVVMLVNPASAAPSSSIDASPSSPSTISQDGSDFTTQAALSSLSARPTNNIVNTNSFYDVVFLTATSGAIKFIQVTFPAGTIVPTSAVFNEAEGIGPGFISQVSGQTVTYTVNNAVNVPVGTKIRLEFANINNPLQPSSNYMVTVTTRDAANAIIDGPTQSTAYTIKQIGSNAIAESFMKQVQLFDDAAGNAAGWNPDGSSLTFSINPAPGVTGGSGNFIVIMQPAEAIIPTNCDVPWPTISFQEFNIVCDNAPQNGATIKYLSINLPNQVIS